MVNIIIGTTPTIIYTFKVVSPANLTKAILTIKSMGQIILEKTLADAAIGDDSLSWTLTQQETPVREAVSRGVWVYGYK